MIIITERQRLMHKYIYTYIYIYIYIYICMYTYKHMSIYIHNTTPAKRLPQFEEIQFCVQSIS